MAHLCKKMLFHFNIKRRVLWRVSILRRSLRSISNRFLDCCSGKPYIRYRQLSRATTATTISGSLPPTIGGDRGLSTSRNMVSSQCCSVDRGRKSSSDLVSLKISLFGDSHIGKTNFLTKYVGGEKEGEEFGGTGVYHIDKTLSVQGARISYSIWEVCGDDSSHDHIPAACKDSVAMLFMFDLTSRCTLNSVITWYQQARKWNQNAIPVLVGTKFDDFVKLPVDLQWTIASQARAYAKALNATLFFSCAAYNINVNKIFKFLTAKLFNLPWNLERNLTIGEPIIDF